MINPFFHRGPVRDSAYFFGRRDEIRFITDLLRAEQSISLNGPRRVGKTSLLFHLAHPEIVADYGLNPDTIRWVYLDGGMLDGLDVEWFYGAIDRALGGQADAVPYAHFVETMRSLTTQNIRLILALDEFELIAANAHFGPTLFNHLRGLAAQFPLQFITASRDPLGELTFAHKDTLSSPFFNIFAPAQLGLFTETAAIELLTTLSTQQGCPFSLETINFILELVGPHPLFLQVAGYRTFTTIDSSGHLAVQDKTTVVSQVETDLEQHLRYYWHNLSPEAQYALVTLPLLDKTIPNYLIATGLIYQTSYLGSTLETFVRQQLVAGVLQNGSFLLDEHQGLAAAYNHPVHLTPTEFATLKLLLQHTGQVITPEAIEAALWPAEITPDPDRARGVIKKLRAALGPASKAIVNRRGQGWFLEF